jgi:hypothetical protein
VSRCVCCPKCCYPATLNVTISGFVGGAMIWNELSNAGDGPDNFRWLDECPGKPSGGHIIPQKLRSGRDTFTSMSLAELNGSWALGGTCGNWSLTKPALCPYVLYRFNPFGDQRGCGPQDGLVSISVIKNPDATPNFTISGYVASGFISASFSTIVPCTQSIINIPGVTPAQSQCCDSSLDSGITLSGSYEATMQGPFPLSPNYDKYPITIQIS